MHYIFALTIFFGFLSAVLWLAAAISDVDHGAYWDGPPPHVREQLRRQKWLNGLAAGTTGISVLLQAIGNWISS